MTPAQPVADLTRTTVEGAALVPLPRLLKDRDADRLRRYGQYLSFYNGTQWAAGRLQPQLRRLTYNYTQTVVDKVASYVLAGFQVSITPHTDAHEAVARAAELALAEIADDNALPQLDNDTEIDCAVLGDAAFELGWSDEERRVTITAPDVAGIFTWTHPTDPLRLRRLAKRYQLPRADIAALWRVTAAHDPDWVIDEWTDDEHGVWIGDGAKLPQFTEPNPYPGIPFVVFPNLTRPKTRWGRSDVPPLMDAARELNREMSLLSNLMELSGIPIAVLSGVDASKGIEIAPGVIWTLPPATDGVRPTADVLDLLRSGAATQHIAYIDQLRQLLYDVAEVPRSAFGSVERTLSGVALEVDLQPLLQKVHRKRVIRSAVYRQRAQLALAILDSFTGSNHAVAGLPAVSWASPTPRDRAREVETEREAVNARISSREKAVERLGDSDPDKEIARIRAEKDLWEIEPAPFDNNA